MSKSFSTTSKKGFASMSPEKRTEIARKGGKAVSSTPGHMAKIGSIGGLASGAARAKKPTVS